jgi:hypothetical protein
MIGGRTELVLIEPQQVLTVIRTMNFPASRAVVKIAHFEKLRLAKVNKAYGEPATLRFKYP